MNKIYNTSLIEGQTSEQQFRNIAINKGFQIRKSCKNDDIKKHIDYYLYRNNKTYSFDVKAAKRNTRRNGSQHDCAIWIEIKNVRGNKGWLYGEQDYIAFDCIDYFLVVRRTELRDYINEVHSINSKYVNKASDALYSLYSRRGRKDLITKINLECLFLLDYRIWNKI